MTQPLHKDPVKAERVGELLSALIDPLNKESYTALGKKHGFDKNAVKRLHVELMSHHQNELTELRELTGRDMLNRIEDKISLALDYMTPRKFGEATIQQVAITFGILAEKRQLLRGEPTQIITIEEDRNLNVLAEAVYTELNRRGMAVNSPMVEGDCKPMDAFVEPRDNPMPKGGMRKSKPGAPQSKLR